MAHKIDADHHFHGAENGLLNRVVEACISGLVCADGLRQGQHAGMFAAAIVVRAVRAAEIADLVDHCFLVGGPMAATGQASGVQIESGEKAFDGGNMVRLPVVTAADQRKLGRGQALSAVECFPCFGKGDGLKRFHRRAGKDRPLDISQPDQHRAVRITQGNIDGMAAFLGAGTQYGDVKGTVRNAGELESGNGHDAHAESVQEGSGRPSPARRLNCPLLSLEKDWSG